MMVISMQHKNIVEKIAASLFFPTIFIFAPIHNVIESNSYFLGYDPFVILASLVTTLLCSLLIYFFLLKPNTKISVLLFRLLTTLSITILVFHLARFLLSDYGYYVIYAIITEVIILVLVTFLIFRTPVFKLLSICSVLGTILFALTTVQYATTFLLSYLQDKVITTKVIPDIQDIVPLTSVNKGNVYHIILDGFQNEAYSWIKDNKPEKTLPKFSYYKNYKSNNSWTLWSLASTFHGRNYKEGESSLEYLQSAYKEKALLHDIDNGGVSIYQYPQTWFYCHEDSYCIPQVHMAKASLKKRFLIDLWFLSIMPSSFLIHTGDLSEIKYDGWKYNFSLMRMIYRAQQKLAKIPAFKSLFDNLTDKKTIIEEPPATSLVMFERMLAEEEYRPAHGQYIFAHLIIPHQPYILDENCKNKGLVANGYDWKDWDSMIAQHECAMHLMQRLIKRLDQLGRLDDSLIIIHGDHGHYWHSKYIGKLDKYISVDKNTQEINVHKAPSNALTPESVKVRSSALLLVHFPKSKEQKESNALTQSLDLAPTILHHYGISTKGYEGIPLQSISRDTKRDILFLHNNVGGSIKKPENITRFKLEDEDWVFDKIISTN